ncbi:MAG: hypothetical protein ABI134_34245, partial [Byssovorax sp.]
SARATARLRTSQITRLVDLTRDARAPGEPARTAAPDAAPEPTPVPVPPPRHRGFELPLALGVLLVTGVVVLVYLQLHRSEPTPLAPSAATASAPALVAPAVPPATEPSAPAPR